MRGRCSRDHVCLYISVKSYEIKDYKDIYEYLQLMEQDGTLSEQQLYNVIQLTERIVDVVAKEADNVKREVSVMGGKVLELESERIFERGIEQGIEQGIERGIEQGIQRGVCESVLGVMGRFKLSFEEACDICNIPKEKYELYRGLIEREM